ncbi:MAG TPA: hypothetical protein VND64_16600 [Pirellulales bacterium]|nr:hypothetical protein [Pirellulales bacterium]
MPSIPGLNHGPGHVNILNGIMALQIVLPDAGPYSPDPFLTYCSKTALQTEYGYGWQGAHKRQLVVIGGATAQITDSAGSIYRFYNKSSAGLYVPAAGITNSLVQNSDGTYTETQPDGFSYRYSSGGQLSRMQTLASQRYTLLYDGGGRVTKVLDPFSRRLTYSYDGSSHIRHIIDVGGRITTFSVDGSGNLASHTAPDGAQTNFRYDGEHKLIAHITPKGLRSSYAYDPTLGWCDKVTTPANERTTIIYEDGTILKPAGRSGDGNTHRH